VVKSRIPFQRTRSKPPDAIAPRIVEGDLVGRLMGRPARAAKRIAAFIAKNHIDGQQDWSARWISFRAIAEYCANLKTPRGAKSGAKGMRHAYRLICEDIANGEFDVAGRCRVLLLVSHGGKIHRLVPNELLEPREAFDPDTFKAGYLDKCWTCAGLVGQWFSRHGVLPPWAEKRPLLRIPRGHPSEAANHAKDVVVIDYAMKIQATQKISDGAAIKAAISRAGIGDKTGSEAARLRKKLRNRRRLRVKNKAISDRR
jgi:hypothetical protein